LLSRTLNFNKHKVGLDLARVILEEEPNAETLHAETGSITPPNAGVVE
jgi:hypothetical protein